MGSGEQKEDFETLAASKGMKAEEYCKILLTEYEEIGRCWRHDFNAAWHFYAIILPACLAALYFSSREQNLNLILLVGLPAVALVWLGFLFYYRARRQTIIRLNRAREIESSFGMQHHILIHDSKIPGLRVWILVQIFTMLVTGFWLFLACLSAIRMCCNY